MALPETVIEIETLAGLLGPGDRLAGLDLGSKTIGVALSDSMQMMANPERTIRRSKFTKDAAELNEVFAAHQVKAIVIGLPVNMDGSSGPRVQATHAFVRNLARVCDLPVVLWDERLSTAAVERMLIEADASRARRAQVVDKLAAAYILQGALDRLATLRRAS